MSQDKRFSGIRLVGTLPVLVAALLFVGMTWGLDLRGVTQEGVWLSEASDHVQGWLRNPGRWSSQAIDAAWSHHAALPPLTVLTTAVMRAITGLKGLEAARLVSCLGLALSVMPLWGLGRRAGGPPAAFAAVAAFIFTPRVLGMAGLPGTGALGCFGLLLSVYALYRARTSVAWTVAAPLALAIGVLTSHVTLLVIVPWLLLTITDKGQVSTMLLEKGRDPHAPDGFLATASFPLRLLTIVPAAAGLVVALYPWLWQSPFKRLWAYLTHFLTQEHEPLLYMGELITTGRLPVEGGLVLLLVTMIPVTCALGLAGVLGEIVVHPLLNTRWGKPLGPHLTISPDPEAAGPEAREAKRWTFSFLLMALLLPWAMAAPHYAGVDLIAMAAAFWSVFVGCAVSRLFAATAVAVRRAAAARTDGRPWWLREITVALALGLFGGIVFSPSIIASIRHYNTAESYHSWIIGGVEGAVDMGLSRNPSAPVSLPIVQAAADIRSSLGKDATMAVLVDEARQRKIIDRMGKEGLVRGLPRWEDRFKADMLLLPHRDNDSHYHQIAHQFAATVAPQDSLVLRNGAIRLVTLGLTQTPKKTP